MKSLRALGMIAVAAAAAGGAKASPLFTAGNGTSTTWAKAISNGNVKSVSSALTGAATTYYAQQVSQKGLTGFQQEVPKLSPDVPISDGSTSKKSLIMSWSQPADKNTLGVSEWSWGYHADPDFTNLLISFDVLAPKGVQNVGIELVDQNGLSEAWFTEQPRLAAWNGKYTVNTSKQSIQGRFETFVEDPGFDITHVLSMRFDETSLPSDPFQVPDPTGNGGAWNAWGDVGVAPEVPPSLPLLCGFLGILGLGRSYKKRSR